MGCFRYIFILLAGLTIVAGFGMIEERDRSLQLRRLPQRLEDTREQMRGMASILRDYARSHGRYPANDEGLLSVKPLVEACEPHGGGLGPFLHWCRVRPSGILTRWGDPFVYENRRGIDPAKFADSGATLDKQRAYSVRVDRDIYIWSIGAKRADQTLKTWRPRLAASQAGVVMIAAIFVVLFVWDSIRSRRRARGATQGWREGIWASAVGLVLALFFPLWIAPAFVKSCYEGSIYWPRKPELTRDCKALLVKYRDRGIISRATCNKITKAMSEHDDSPSGM